MLSTPPELWAARLDGDRKMFSDQWDDLVRTRAPALGDALTPEVWAQRHAQVQVAIGTLSSVLAAAEVDVALIIGDDQQELFPPGTIAPITIWCADSAEDGSPDPKLLESARAASVWAYFSPDGPTTYPCRGDLARHLIAQLGAAAFDVGAVAAPPPGRHLGHAFTFVQRRIADGTALPMVPILLNSFYPLSQPSVRRCHELGVHLANAIAAWPGSERVALVASGGLSHHLVDEAFDRRLLAALASTSPDNTLALPAEAFSDGAHPCGTGESKNWIVVGSAAREMGLKMEVVEYEPLIRTPAGTGVGAAFVHWS
jgi:hypothetical protein